LKHEQLPHWLHIVADKAHWMHIVADKAHWMHIVADKAVLHLLFQEKKLPLHNNFALLGRYIGG